MIQQKRTEGSRIKGLLSTPLNRIGEIVWIGVEEVGIDLLTTTYSRGRQNSYDGNLRRENAQNSRSAAGFGGVAA